MATSEKDNFWRKTINALGKDLPEDGKSAPNIESNPPRKRRAPANAANKKVTVQKIATVVYVFTDIEGRAYTSNASQHLYILGQMTLEEGLKLAQEDKA